MTRKELKLSDTSRGLPENFDLWEELEDQAGEKIRGGQALPISQQPQRAAGTKGVVFPFEFENTVNNVVIDVILLNGGAQVIELEPFGQPGDTIIVNRPSSIITIEFDATPSIGGDPLVRTDMAAGIGVFELGQNNMIVFFQE